MSEPGSTTGDADPVVAAQEHEVERNREQLAGTVDALQAKLDVKAHAQESVRNAKARVTTPDGGPRPALLAAAAGLVLGAAALVWWRRR